MNSCSRIAFLAFLSFFFACTEKEAAQVTAWAKTRHSDKVDPLTDDEIQLLKDLML